MTTQRHARETGRGAPRWLHMRVGIRNPRAQDVLAKLETLRLNGSHSTSAYRRIAADGIRLPTTEQAL
jgi:hypothetical protein